MHGGLEPLLQLSMRAKSGNVLRHGEVVLSHSAIPEVLLLLIFGATQDLRPFLISHQKTLESPCTVTLDTSHCLLEL